MAPKQTAADRDSVQIFDLDEQTASPPIDIHLTWVDAHTLAIEYSQPANVDFQAVRVADIDIVACGPSTPPNPRCPLRPK